MTLDELMGLYQATSTEAEDVLSKVAENGRTTLKPGSPALAIFYAYDELFITAMSWLFTMQGEVRRAAELN